MASSLKKKGYTNIKILEKTDRVGGKSYTVHRDGVPHEMGTCYLHNEYDSIRALISEYTMDQEEVVAEGRAIFSNRVTGKPHVALDLTEWLFGYVAWDVKRSGHWLRYLPEKARLVKMVADVNKYIGLHDELFGSILNKAMPPRLSRQKMAQIDMTFGEFLHKHGMTTLLGLLELSQSAQGYGYMETVPAFYGLWWTTPGLLTNVLKSKIPGVETTPSLVMLKKGYAHLWQTMHTTDNLDVTLNAEVTSITRTGAAKNGVTVIHKAAGGKLKAETFDFLILAAPFKDALRYLDANAQETKIFSTLQWFRLTTTLYEGAPVATYSDQASKRSIAYWDDNLIDGGQGHINCDRYSKAAVFGPAAADWTGPQTRVAYQFLEPDANDDGSDLRPPFAPHQGLLATLKADWAAKGFKDTKVIEQFPWKYFPHFDNEAIAKGYPWEILDMQGAHGMWYIGSSACFESVHDVVNYNLLLLERTAMP
jgi:hypothetical protein